MVDRSKGHWPLGSEFEHGPSVLLPHAELTGIDPYRVVRVRDVAVGPRLPAVGPVRHLVRRFRQRYQQRPLFGPEHGPSGAVAFPERAGIGSTNAYQPERQHPATNGYALDASPRDGVADPRGSPGKSSILRRLRTIGLHSRASCMPRRHGTSLSPMRRMDHILGNAGHLPFLRICKAPSSPRPVGGRHVLCSKPKNA